MRNKRTPKNIMNDLGLLSPRLNYFISVYEQKSIHASSRKLGLDPANISRMIKALEKSCGTQLFVRHKNGLHATQSAQVLYKAVTAAQLEYSQVINSTSRVPRTIRIGFSAAIGHSYFSYKFMNVIQQQNLAPTFTIDSSTALVEKIKSRELDFAMVNTELKFPGLVVKRMQIESLVLCSRSSEITDTLVYHPDTLALEQIIHSIRYKSRWMVRDYFLILKFLMETNTLMGVLPESMVTKTPDLHILEKMEGVGKITALSWPSSIGLELMKLIERSG